MSILRRGRVETSVGPRVKIINKSKTACCLWFQERNDADRTVRCEIAGRRPVDYEAHQLNGRERRRQTGTRDGDEVASLHIHNAHASTERSYVNRPHLYSTVSDERTSDHYSTSSLSTSQADPSRTNVLIDKKLSRRRETARCAVLFKIVVTLKQPQKVAQF